MGSRILGIDPGYGTVGWSVIYQDLTIVDFGTIQTSPDKSIPERLNHIYEGFREIVSTFNPQEAAMERLFFYRNTTTAMDVSKASGAILLALYQGNISTVEYTPTQIKQALTGSGKAGKGQMQSAIMQLFKLKEIPKPDDAADALAIAACHSFALR